MSGSFAYSLVFVHAWIVDAYVLSMLTALIVWSWIVEAYVLLMLTVLIVWSYLLL